MDFIDELKDKCPTHHKNKTVGGDMNMDGEVYYNCPDCDAGWRQLPETEEDTEKAWEGNLQDARAIFTKEELKKLGLE